MNARPILLVADARAGEGMKLHAHTSELLAREGYLVMHCEPEHLGMFKVLTPCPFTWEDIAFVREIASFGLSLLPNRQVELAKLTSIADRMENLL